MAGKIDIKIITIIAMEKLFAIIGIFPKKNPNRETTRTQRVPPIELYVINCL